MRFEEVYEGWLERRLSQATPKTWPLMPTVAVSRSMPGCASKPPTAQGWSDKLRYCAPPFAMGRLKQCGTDLVYRCGKGHTNDSEALQSDKYPGELVLTPLELIDRIAQLMQQPRTYRHRYYGVLAPNSPLREAMTAIVQVAQVLTPNVRSPATQSACTDAGTTVAVGGSGVSGVAAQPEPQAKSTSRSPASYLWAALIARIYEVFRLICPHCGGTMRIQ